MRKALIAGNWKMNKTAREATKLIQQLSYSFDDSFTTVEVVICPPFTALRSAQVSLDFDTKSKILIGAQDVYWEPAGAFTGAISVDMLKDVSCSYCIVGHSERREFFHETDEDVARKTEALVKAGLSPIICCGESLDEHEKGQAIEVVTAQIQAALAEVSVTEASTVVLAYEPIWAIGTGRTPLPEQADEVCAALRSTCTELYGPTVAEAVRILYGGSMNPGNVDAFRAMPDIDGGLVGGASLEAESFMALVKAFA